MPELKKAAEGASFEARARLEPIIKGLKAFSGGVVIVAYQRLGYGGAMVDIEGHPGDIFYRINDTPIGTVEDWDRFWEKAEYGRYILHGRPVARGNPEREWDADPYNRRPHFFLMDYKEQYAPVLREALADAWDQRFEQADREFDEAVRAGVPSSTPTRPARSAP